MERICDSKKVPLSGTLFFSVQQFSNTSSVRIASRKENTDPIDTDLTILNEAIAEENNMTAFTMKTMNDDMLSRVNGGDYGDTAAETKWGLPIYRPGQIVEIYTSFLHITTYTVRIKAVIRVYADSDYCYLVDTYPNSTGAFYAFADDFERPSGGVI